MKEKLLFFDIDGTLITEEDGTMPESTKESSYAGKGAGTFPVYKYRTNMEKSAGKDFASEF